MDNVKTFDILTAPLKGRNLIEASAGTGKTYTIAGLFLRLIIEKEIPVEKILVVTFTEAATEELKTRIRQQLRNAVEVIASGSSRDPFLTSLLHSIPDQPKALELVKSAVRSFDQSSIFTIHGFCMRMLKENAFESGNLFDTELVTSQEDILREITYDFWRNNIYDAPPVIVRYILNKNITPDKLLSFSGKRAARHDLKVIPQVKRPDTSSLEKRFAKIFKKTADAWMKARNSVEEIFFDPGLKKGMYNPKSIPNWLQQMDDLAGSDGSRLELFDKFVKFTSFGIKQGTKKNCQVREHPFFDLCEEMKTIHDKLTSALNQYLLWLRAELLKYTRTELLARKQKKRIQSFDDLLLKMHSALQGRGGKKFAKHIRGKFSAALIDEFQDTDPVQYTIFSSLFKGKQSILFLIGDPKQAIYGFRGADIFAYMDAAKHVDSRYTLKDNWRSEPGLIKAVNTLFKKMDPAFVYREIPFTPVSSPENKEHHFFTQKGRTEPNLQIWHLASQEKKPIKKDHARKTIREAVAIEISRLLDLGKKGDAKIGEQHLTAGHIAVLVRTNREAGMIQEALYSYSIPGVIYSSDDLFKSFEAGEMEKLLSGIIFPGSERTVKAALTTDMLGVTGEGIEQLTKDNTSWDNWLIKFSGYHDLWHGKGFIRMFKQLMKEERILRRLMLFHDGERRCTNILHLAEVLHRVSSEKNTGMEGLLKWLSNQIDSPNIGDREHQQRLESDENAVKIVTVHKSKGLEYPVVFCPFGWDSSKVRGAEVHVSFHDEKDKMRLTVDIGSDRFDKNRLTAEKELLAENVRLLYVALTRAKNRCYFVWGKINQAETSAPAYLFHNSKSGEAFLKATPPRFKTMTDEDILKDLAVIINKSKKNISVSPIPEDIGKVYSPAPATNSKLICREFSGSIKNNWRMSSFSSLVYQHPHGAELADRDTADHIHHTSQEMFDELPTGIFSFPKGARPGIFMHDVFENLDFTSGKKTHIEEVVIAKLKEYSFEASWGKTICDMARNVLSTQLEAENIFSLSDITSDKRLNELEFYFPLKKISPEKLKNLFKKHAGQNLTSHLPEQIGRLDFSPTKGFMKGFIDLVFEYNNRFYILDWKSNHLGNRVEDYGQDALQRAMDDHLYVLQYYIYTLALHQYLGVRLPGYNYEKHFGGVYYIFVRGVDPSFGPDFGIFHDRPPYSLIKDLRENMN